MLCQADPQTRKTTNQTPKLCSGLILVQSGKHISLPCHLHVRPATKVVSNLQPLQTSAACHPSAGPVVLGAGTEEHRWSGAELGRQRRKLPRRRRGHSTPASRTPPAAEEGREGDVPDDTHRVKHELPRGHLNDDVVAQVGAGASRDADTNVCAKSASTRSQNKNVTSSSIAAGRRCSGARRYWTESTTAGSSAKKRPGVEHGLVW
jgi:hypothetical protein